MDYYTKKSQATTLIRQMIRKAKIIKKANIYTQILETYGLSKKFVDNYLTDLEKQGIIEERREDIHFIYIPEKKEKNSLNFGEEVENG